jgi:hypothetical protein
MDIVHLVLFGSLHHCSPAVYISCLSNSNGFKDVEYSLSLSVQIQPLKGDQRNEIPEKVFLQVLVSNLREGLFATINIIFLFCALKEIQNEIDSKNDLKHI